MKKNLLLIFCSFIAIFSFAQEFSYFSESTNSKSDFIKLVKNYVVNESLDSKTEVLLKAKDFYSVQNFSIEDFSSCALCVSQAVYFEKFIAPHISDSDFSSQMKKYSEPYIKTFCEKSTNLFELNPKEVSKKTKYLAFSDCEYFSNKIKNENYAFSQTDLIYFLNRPSSLFVLLNNSEYEILKTEFIKTFSAFFSVTEEEFSENCANHQNFILFPSKIYEFYSQIGDENLDYDVLAIYEFSKELNDAYFFACENQDLFENYFLPNEFSCLNALLNDGFSVFSLKNEAVNYFIERFKAISLVLCDF